MSNPTKNTLGFIEVSGTDIQSIIWGRLMPAVEGAPMDQTIISLITLSILLMKPTVELEVLKQAVLAATSAITMTISPVDPSKAN